MSRLYRTPPRSREYIRALLERIVQVREPMQHAWTARRPMAVLRDFDQFAGCQRFQRFLVGQGIAAEIQRGDGNWEVVIGAQDRVRGESLLAMYLQALARTPRVGKQYWERARAPELPPHLARIASLGLLIGMAFAVFVTQAGMALTAYAARGMVSPLYAMLVIAGVGVAGGYAMGLLRAASSAAHGQQSVARDALVIAVAVLGAILTVSLFYAA